MCHINLLFTHLLTYLLTYRWQLCNAASHQRRRFSSHVPPSVDAVCTYWLQKPITVPALYLCQLVTDL